MDIGGGLDLVPRSAMHLTNCGGNDSGALVVSDVVAPGASTRSRGASAPSPQPAMPSATSASRRGTSFFKRSSCAAAVLVRSRNRIRRLQLTLTCHSAGVLPPEQPDPQQLRDNDGDDDEAEQDRVGGCLPQQRAVEERVHDHEREQDVVQALEPLPVLRFQLPQGGVAGEHEQPGDDHERGQPGPVSPPEAVGLRGPVHDEEVEEVADRAAAVHLERDNHMGAAE